MPTCYNLLSRPTAGLTETPAPAHTPLPLWFAAPELVPAIQTTAIQRRLVLGNDPALVPPLVALIGNDLVEVGICDRHTAGRVGIAIEEAILNAIYHGNLEISSVLKENGDEPFRAKARERQHLTPFCHRTVRFIARVTWRRATFVIADEGPGFDVANLPDPTDPENLIRPSGRGLLLMRAFMDRVEYNATGNRVTMTKLRSAE